MTKQKTNKKATVAKVASVVGVGALIAGGLIGAGISAVATEPKVVYNETLINATPKQLQASFDAGVASVEPVVINNTEIVTKEVLVDNGNLEVVLQHIYDNDGSVEYLTDDLKDSEVAEIADRVIFINEAKTIAMQVAEDEIADLVDKEVVNGEELDEDDVEKIKVEDEFDKLTVDDVDFDDLDAEILVPVDFEHDDVDYEAVVKVTFKNGEYDDVELVSVDEE